MVRWKKRGDEDIKIYDRGFPVGIKAPASDAVRLSGPAPDVCALLRTGAQRSSVLQGGLSSASWQQPSASPGNQLLVALGVVFCTVRGQAACTGACAT